jgi:hypothetical protein
VDWRQIEKSTKSYPIPTLSLLGFHLTRANHGLQVYIEQNKKSSLYSNKHWSLNKGTESRRVPKTYLSWDGLKATGIPIFCKVS